MELVPQLTFLPFNYVKVKQDAKSSQLALTIISIGLMRDLIKW